jgi:hypothetical protein
MHAQPPTAKLLYAAFDHPWLPPVRYGVKPYLEFCQSIDEALRSLEARYPSHQRFSVEDRRRRLFGRPE